VSASDLTTTRVAEAIAQGRIGSRLYVYANYHCNLACSYCLTESAPDVPARMLSPDRIEAIAAQAPVLGFRGLGVTGGEPFLVSEMPELLLRLTDILPVVVLSNGTLFSNARLDRLRPLGGRDVRIQISLDSSDPVANDEMRGPENFRKVVEAIPKLLEMGIGVRIASTRGFVDEDDMAALCELHRALGVPDEEHIVRGVVRRGRAATNQMGEPAGSDELAPELTVTADGSFWSPFGPTVTGGRLDVDLLVTRAIDPLEVPATALVDLVAGRGFAGPIDDRFT
jgi:MoaA/NifB/PqqE/SkfB family radical SAM enzyme